MTEAETRGSTAASIATPPGLTISHRVQLCASFKSSSSGLTSPLTAAKHRLTPFCSWNPCRIVSALRHRSHPFSRPFSLSLFFLPSSILPSYSLLFFPFPFASFSTLLQLIRLLSPVGKPYHTTTTPQRIYTQSTYIYTQIPIEKEIKKIVHREWRAPSPEPLPPASRRPTTCPTPLQQTASAAALSTAMTVTMAALERTTAAAWTFSPTTRRHRRLIFSRALRAIPASCRPLRRQSSASTTRPALAQA